MFSNKTLRVSIPKAQYRLLLSLLDQMEDDQYRYTIDDLVQLAIKDLIDKHFSDTAKKISRNIKKLAR